MNKTGITTTPAITPKTILVAPELAVSLPVVVGNAGLESDLNVKRILKAGTPLYGNLQARNTAFVRATTTTATTGTLVVPDGGGTVVLPTPATSNVVGLILKDVDVTSANGNGAILIQGIVNMDKLDTDVQALITADVIAALKGSITFVK